MPSLRPGPAWAFFLLFLAALSVTHYGGTTSHLFSTHDEEYLDDAEAAQGNVLFVVSPDRIYPGRPTHSLFLWGAIKFLGREPAAYHVLIVFLHGLCAVLLTQAAHRFGMDRTTAMLGGVLFVACVAHFRVVHWIACLGYLLALICLLGAFLLHMDTGRRSAAREAGAVGLFVLACFSHPAACAGALFPAIRAALSGRTFRESARQALPFLAAAAVCAVILTVFYAETRQMAVNTQARRITHLTGNFLWLWGRLLSTAFWLPTGLHLGTPYAAEQLAGGAMFLACAAVIWKAPEHARLWAAWTLLFILPFVNSNMVANVSGPSRHLFLASAGFALVVAWGLRRAGALLSNARLSNATVAAVTLVLLVSSGIGLDRADALSRYHSGRYYISEEHYKIGVSQMERAILHHAEILPSDAYLRTGLAGLIDGNANLALFTELARKHPTNPDIRLALGAAHLLGESQAEKQKGADIIYEAVEMSGKPDDYAHHAARFFNNVGTYLMDQGRNREAAEMFRGAVEWRPVYELAHSNLAKVLLAAGDTTSAIESLRKSIELKPTKTEAYHNLGVLLAQRAEYEEAIAVLRRSLELAPNEPKVYANLGVMHIRRGELDQAEDAFRKTLELDPREVNAHIGMAMLSARRGDLATTASEYRKVLEIDPSRDDVRALLRRLSERIEQPPARP